MFNDSIIETMDIPAADQSPVSIQPPAASSIKGALTAPVSKELEAVDCSDDSESRSPHEFVWIPSDSDDDENEQTDENVASNDKKDIAVCHNNKFNRSASLVDKIILTSQKILTNKCLSNDVQVKVSPVLGNGFGLFALRAFRQYETIVAYTGEVLTQSEYDKRYPTVLAKKHARYVRQFYRNQWVDTRDPSKSSLGRYVNYQTAEKANARFSGSGNIWAKHDINAGDEIFVLDVVIKSTALANAPVLYPPVAQEAQTARPSAAAAAGSL
jgi:hypothetical protein